MSTLMWKYSPKTLSEFVGEKARKIARAIIARRLSTKIKGLGQSGLGPIYKAILLLLIGDKGSGKTTLARLIAKAHFCTEGKDGGPCGTCETCLRFESQFDTGIGFFEIPPLPSRTLTTKEGGLYRFRAYDFADISADQIREIKKEIAPSHDTAFYRQHPEIVTIDEVHRADKPKQEMLLTSTDGELLSSVVCCVAKDNIHRVDTALLRRFMPIYLDPEIGEVVTFARHVADTEGLEIASETALLELVDGVGLVQSDVLLMLEMALSEGESIASDWVRATLPKIKALRISEGGY